MKSTKPEPTPSPMTANWTQPAGWWRVRGASTNALLLGAGLAPKGKPGADIDDSGHTLWHYWAEGVEGAARFDLLAKHKHLTVTDYLQQRSRGGEHPWHRLLMRGQIEAIQAWKKRFGEVDLDLRNEHGDDMLMAACWSGDKDTVEWVLSQGAGTDARDLFGRNALIIALHRCGHESSLALVMAGADPSAQDQQGRSAMHHAASVAMVDILPVMEDAGGDPDAVDATGASANTLLERALRMDTVSIEAAATYWKRRHQDRLTF